MGMTIDKSILYMSLYKQRLEESISDGLEEDIEAYDVAMNTMRKFQRIQEIVKAWNDMNSFDSMVQISEVLEDGKID